MEVELRAERMAAGGDAIAREPSGRIVFVSGALPGELVLVTTTTEKRDYAKAVVADVLEPSPHRVTAPCPNVARGCGGCSWQHITPAAQQEIKRNIVVDALRRTGHLSYAEVVLGRSLPSERFRTSLRLAVDGNGHLGFRGRRSHDIVAVDDCLVAHPFIASLVADVRLPGAEEATLRCGARTGERSLAWSAAGDEQVRASGVPVDVSCGWDGAVTEIVAGHQLRVSARSFMQSSPEAAEALASCVAHAAGSIISETKRPVIDAYGGIGLFAVTTAAEAGQVVVIEGSPSACGDARHNLRNRPATVVHSAVERWTPVPADVVIADPARQGLGRAGVRTLAATGCEVLVLVSCDPVSLARDAALLAADGLVHAGSVVLDPFPHTPHIEVVTRFERRTG
ncbi:MAG: class I SAM-dependent RNA methyltransferase [Acidimicrobiia bacterium]